MYLHRKPAEDPGQEAVAGARGIRGVCIAVMLVTLKAEFPLSHPIRILKKQMHR